jgi:hypothetical protein
MDCGAAGKRQYFQPCGKLVDSLAIVGAGPDFSAP